MSSTAFVYDRLLAGDFDIVSGRETLLAGQGVLTRGTVLGKITKALGAAVAAGAGVAGANTGNGAVGTISMGAETKLGSYIIKMTAATTFTVVSPEGARLPDGVAGTAYADAQINFTVTAGGTAFVAGDGFSIPVAAGSGKLKVVNSANVDGSQSPYAILAEAVDTTSDAPGAVYKAGEYNEAALTFGGTDTADTHRDAARRVSLFFKKIHPEAT